MTAVVFFISFILISYFLFILILKRGWNIARSTKASATAQIQAISVIIPVRNESSRIGILLGQLKAMSYPDFEVIVVDDHSDDTTVSIVEGATRFDSRFRLINNDGVGKKQAITTGVGAAKGSVIVTTDGDCEVQLLWLTAINKAFNNANVKMVFGGVSIHGATFFSHVQALEFSSLIGSGISLWALGKPVMCNGANLAFRKEVFKEVGGYAGNEHIASGDDEFLMRKIVARYPSGVMFLNDSEGNVRTGDADDIETFIRQRLRWAGKWRHNQSLTSKLTAVYVVWIQLAILAAFSILVIFPGIVTLAVIALLLTRFIAEAWLLIPVCRFLKIKFRWGAFVVLQFIYPFYVVGIGLFSNFTTVKWKDRRI